ncbi:MAG: TonB-dependent receptor [Acidobacteriota bacterium]|nr:TonB-dependent receptor [Acidobacteriota bacterium]
MKKSLAFLTSILLVVLCLSASVLAQETSGNIEGTVKDPTGAVVPNATVIVAASDRTDQTNTSSTTGFRRTVQTNDEGFFRVLQVPPGLYTVRVEPTAGFGASVVQNVQVVLETTTPVNVTVAAAGAGETVVDIQASDQPVDPTDTKVATSITAQRIELLPKGVDFTSVLKTVPGTRPEANAGGFSVDGASGSENVFIIDGQEVTNFRTGTLNANNAIPTQFVQEVQVKSSGFEAEFGGATGGVINVVTKGGGNDWRGEFGIQFNTPKLNGRNRPTLLFFPAFTATAANPFSYPNTTEYFRFPKTQGTNVFPTANLSGPIIKDRLWFFASYTPQYEVSEVTTTYFTNRPAAFRSITGSETYRRKRTYEYAFTRLDASPTNNLRLTGTFTWNPIIDEGALPHATANFGGVPVSTNFGGNIGTLTGRQLTDRQGGRQNSNNVTGQAVWTPTSNLVVSGRFSRGFLNQKLGNYFVPSAARYRCIENFGSVAGGCPQGQADPNNNFVNYDVSVRTNWEADATYIASGFLGRHEFKGGYQRFKILNDVSSGFVNKGWFDFYFGRSIDEYLGFPVDPSCVNAAGTAFAPCVRNAQGTVTNRAPICAAGQTAGCILGTGELIRFGTEGRGQNTNQSIYIQDKWQPVNNLTLNLGVRAEKEDLPSFNNLAPPINFGWGDKIAPRIGVAWDIFSDGKTRLFASYGKFYDRLKFELPRGSFGGDFYRIDAFEIFPGQDWRSFTLQNVLGSFTDPSGGACPQTGFIASGARSRCQFDYRIASNSPESTLYTGAVDPNLKSFQQTEFTAGLERQFGRDYVVRGRYTFKNVDKAIEDAGIYNAQGSEAYIIGNPGEGLHLQVLKELGYEKSTKPQRRYDAMEIALEKRLSNNYYFNANYTLSRLYGNYSGLASSDEAGRTSPGVNRFFDLPFLGFTATGEPDNGRLSTDRPHVFNLYGAYIFNWFGSRSNSTELSAFTTAQSGTPVTTVVPFLISATAGSPIFTRRGDLGRTEMFTQTDFAVQHKYRFGRDERFTMSFDLNILNLFDEENVTGIYSNPTQTSSFGRTTAGFGGGSYVDVINRFNRGELLTALQNLVNNTATRDPRYQQANAFQGPRSVRFGFRLLF